MARSYRGETREIVDDLLEALARRPELDPYFLGELRRLAQQGALGKEAAVRQAVRILNSAAAAGVGDDED